MNYVYYGLCSRNKEDAVAYKLYLRKWEYRLKNSVCSESVESKKNFKKKSFKNRFHFFNFSAYYICKVKSQKTFGSSDGYFFLYKDKTIYIPAVLQICACDTTCATRKISVRQSHPLAAWLVYSYFFNNFRKFFNCMHHANLQLAAAVFGSF